MIGHTPWLFDNVDTAIFMKNNKDQHGIGLSLIQILNQLLSRQQFTPINFGVFTY